MSVREEIRSFYFSKFEILQYLLDEPPRQIDAKIYEKRIVSFVEFPPEVQAQTWTKTDKTFSFAGCSIRKIDPKVADEMIADGSLISTREGEYELRRGKVN